LSKQDRGNRQGPNTGSANATSEVRGKNRKAPQPTAPPSVAGEQGTPPAVGEQGSAPRNVSKQGRDNRQGTGAGGQNATSGARAKNRKAPQPIATPSVAREQGTLPASGDQQSAVRNVNKQEKSSRPKSAAVDASRDRRRQSSNDGQGGGPRDSKKNAQSGARVSRRQRIPVHRSKNSRSRSTMPKARLLSQAPLSSARTSENASRSLLHSRQPQSKTNLHHSSRQPQSKTGNLRGPPRPSKRRLPSLLMHRRVRVKARAAGKRSPTRRKTKAATEPVG
jgi:hypothetical protein